jgi:hypothetical protein
MFHGMFHEIIKFGFETFADMEHRGQHSLPRMTLDRTYQSANLRIDLTPAPHDPGQNLEYRDETSWVLAGNTDCG